jgi:hypothetical protein
VIRRKRSRPPRSAVVENAAKVSFTNSWASQSKRRPSGVWRPVRQAMISMMTAKIGTPRMNAAKLRWIWAMTHTASREPVYGKAR